MAREILNYSDCAFVDDKRKDSWFKLYTGQQIKKMSEE
jgi:hypothetical protein